MADELRERARKFLNDTERVLGGATVSALVEFAAAERALAIEECCKAMCWMCRYVKGGLDLGAEVYSATLDNRFRHEVKYKNGSGFREECRAIHLRKLATPLPTAGEDFGDVSEDQK